MKKKRKKATYLFLVFIVALVLIIIMYGRDLQDFLNFIGIGYNVTYPVFTFIQYSVCALVLIFLVLLIFFKITNYYYSRAIQPHAAEMMENDKRKPIFILRPFKSDNKKIFPINYNNQTHVDIESVLASALGNYGPVVAIGKPEEVLQPRGAARLYVDDTWKDTVELLVKYSSVVILIIDFTPGVKWEINKVLKDCRDKVIIIPKLHSTLLNNVVDTIYAIPLTYTRYLIGKPLRFIFERYWILGKLRRGFKFYHNWDKFVAKEVDAAIPKINDKVSALIYTENGYKTFITKKPSNEVQINSVLQAIFEKCGELCDDSVSCMDEEIRNKIDSITTDKSDFDYNNLNIFQKIKFIFGQTNKQGLRRSIIKCFCIIVVIAGIFVADYIIHDKTVEIEAKSCMVELMGEELDGEYTGEWRHRKPFGEGYFIIEEEFDDLTNGDYLIGDWENGFFTDGEIVYNDTQTILYRGEFKEGYFDGEGILVSDDGSYYVGQFRDGTLNGEGAIYDSNDVLLMEGAFKNGEYQE